MTEKRFKMSNSRVKATGIILEKELSTDEVFNEIVYLTNENEQLNSIKQFAERNGINILSIDDAFYNCWNDNGKLVKENEDLKKRFKREKEVAMSLGSECDKLTKENKQLKQLLDYADDLILSYMSVHNRDEWENIKKNIKGDVE